MLSDPIGDMLSRIRNGYMAKKRSVTVIFSKLNQNILALLQKNGYIGVFSKKIPEGKLETIKVDLKYNQNQPAIEKIRRISKPGRRVYINSRHLKPVMSGFGMMIISTSKGLMTNKEAKSKNQGGELLCEVW